MKDKEMEPQQTTAVPSTTDTSRSVASPQNETFGVILLGNSGAGKSFLLNTLIGHDKFASEISETGVTRDVSSDEQTVSDDSGVFYNVKLLDIPGLIESNQEEINRNKQKIHEAFQTQPKSIVGFVFNVFRNGRLKNDDVIAFNAIKDAYALNKESLCFIINGMPAKKIPPTYKGKLIMQLERMTGISGVSQCFLKDIDEDDVKERKQLKTDLIVGLLKCKAETQQMRHDIELETDTIRELQEQLKAQTSQWEQQLQQVDSLRAEVELRQKQHNEETESLRQAVEQAQRDRIGMEALQHQLQMLQQQLQNRPKEIIKCIVM